MDIFNIIKEIPRTCEGHLASFEKKNLLLYAHASSTRTTQASTIGSKPHVMA
jgi:hypothetical protein